MEVLYMQYESERIEYKSQMIDDIYKEVIAFANTDGGVIYLGIDDKGNQIGIDNVDETYTRLTNGIRDAIAPDVTMFVRYVLQDNKVIRIEVGEGSYIPPYTPEMNPIEQIWKEIRKRGFRNEVFATLEKVVDRLCDTICSLTTNTIFSITGRDWIIKAFN